MEEECPENQEACGMFRLDVTSVQECRGCNKKMVCQKQELAQMKGLLERVGRERASVFEAKEEGGQIEWFTLEGKRETESTFLPTAFFFNRKP